MPDPKSRAKSAERDAIIKIECRVVNYAAEVDFTVYSRLNHGLGNAF
jgi:hypothetical protein